MEISTTWNGRKYTYKFNGSFYTWVDERNLSIPIITHTTLREKALKEGADESIFLSGPRSPSAEKADAKKEAAPQDTKSDNSKKKTNLKNGFNPFNIGG